MYTPGYAAPEQYHGKFTLGPWTDIYAVGACMYAALTGAAPQAADERLVDDQLLPARQRGAEDYSPRLLATIDECLRLEPHAAAATCARPAGLARYRASRRKAAGVLALALRPARLVMNYTIAHDTRIGGREINQDRAAWLATEKAVLMVVADGMGGHLQGEVAAQIAIDTLVERFRAEARTAPGRPGGFLARHRAAGTPDHRPLRRRLPHSGPCRAAHHLHRLCGAGRQASWAHAGDSRLYLIHQHPRGPAKVARTRDHSVVQRMVDDGSISAAEAIGHPLRNRVFSCLGGDARRRSRFRRQSAADGDLLALCTDGAWSPLGESLVSRIGRAPLTTTVPHLLDAAERAAGPARTT
jgi:serine/threonine protein phosphatase PrpC